MKKQFIILFCLASTYIFAQNKVANPVQIVNYNEFKAITQKNDNKLYVINFWATWCKPCVEELPAFMEVNNFYKKSPKYEMILVSMDMVRELETVVKPFLLKKKIDTKVLLLNDVKKMNEWIPATDANWTGAIPATVLYRNGKKLHFTEGQLSKDELKQLINKYL